MKKQFGGNGYTINVNEQIGKLPSITKYTNNFQPIFEGELLQNGGKCNCVKKNNDTSVFNLIKPQKGGNQRNNIISPQFYAIKKLAILLKSIPTNNLIILIIELFINIHPTKNSKYNKIHLYNKIKHLGKMNLLILTSMLLLHFFSMESMNKNKNKNKNIYTLHNILKPKITFILKDSFSNKKSNSKNSLKKYVNSLNKESFYANGMMVNLKKLFKTNIKNVSHDKNFEKIFHLLSPISFNIFAKKSFLENFSQKYIVQNGSIKKRR
jgi:hypothetical protein